MSRLFQLLVVVDCGPVSPYQLITYNIHQKVSDQLLNQTFSDHQ